MIRANGLIAAMLAGIVGCIAGCMSAPPAAPEPIKAAPIPPPAPITSSAPAQPSTLTYGMVTSQVRKGETRQLDLVQLFGSPNISTYDSAGIETWVYERTVSQTDIQQNSRAVQGAVNLGAFFNFGQAGGGVAGSQGNAASSATTSVRSITVIVKFSADRIVSDYSVRASYF